jgi:hypothetical protein
MEIHAEPIDAFQSGAVTVMCVTKAGNSDMLARDGSTVKVPYREGDVILVGDDSHLICGPVGFDEGVAFAERVLEGDQRALTQPVGIQMLATIIVALSTLPQFQPPADPVARKPEGFQP